MAALRRRPGRIGSWDELAEVVGRVLDGADDGRPLHLDLDDVEVDVPGAGGHVTWRLRGRVGVRSST